MKKITIIILILLINLYLIDIAKYPEKHFTTCRNTLHEQIMINNQDAIEYYNNVYVANGIILFE